MTPVRESWERTAASLKGCARRAVANARRERLAACPRTATWWLGKAVVVSKRPRYQRTFYASARTLEGAIKAVQRDAIGLPKGAQYTGHLAGPSELGCVRTTGELS